ncbi:MAG TPA: hypothetical protein VFO19_06985, partial [Vicinamibacterales bacterium]|nr:hypothetical protein [Vicinamibacterales bacterium]
MPSSPGRTDRVVGVAVPVPGLGLLSYGVPAGAAPPPKGARVNVPLGPRLVTGIVVDPDADVPEGAELKDIVEILDVDPFLPPAIVDLALWVGDYYASGPGDALTVALPPAARRGARHAFRSVSRATLTDAGRAAAAKGAKQRDALSHLAARAEGLTLPELLKLGVSTATVRSLARG